MNPQVLIIDDEKTFRLVVQSALAAEGYGVSEAATGRLGLARLAEHNPDVVILDWNLPDTDGLALLERIQASGGREAPMVIMATAFAEVDNAVKALKAGAYDYLTKPLQLPQLMVTVHKALEARRLRRTVRALQGQQQREVIAEDQLGSSPAIRRALEMLAKVSASPDTTVLIEGESGTGKEIFARLLHARSANRGEGPFIELNCGGMPETLVESELFGHMRGAFTDARADREGLLEMADGGTLFLDEIGEMPLGVQAKLLRVLETSKFRRLGGTRDLSVDVRFVAATNRDLLTEVGQGRFRLDLYHRLDVFRLSLPALRERRDDIIPVARRLIADLARKLGKRINGLAPEAEARLQAYSFPGNVRELRNILERAAIIETSEQITASSIVLGRSGDDARGPASWIQFNLKGGGEPPTLDEVEKQYVSILLEYAEGNRAQVARLMDVSYPTVMKKIADYGIDLSRWVRAKASPGE